MGKEGINGHGGLLRFGIGVAVPLATTFVAREAERGRLKPGHARLDLHAVAFRALPTPVGVPMKRILRFKSTYPDRHGSLPILDAAVA